MTFTSLANGGASNTVSVRRRFCEVRVLGMHSTYGTGGGGRGMRIVDRSTFSVNCLSCGSFVP